MFKYIGIVIALIALIGCGGGTSSTSSTSVEEDKALDTYFSIDEEDFKDPTAFSNKLVGEDPNAKLEVENTKDALFTTKSEFDGSSIDVNVSTMKTYVGKALFVDGLFEGIISDVTQKDVLSSNVVIEDAQDISQVYDKVELDFSLETMASDLTRSLKSRSIGRYDYLNSQKLKASVKVKNISKVRGVENNELVLRIDIPKDYTMKINPKARGLECDIFDAKCIAEIETTPEKKFSLEQNLTEYGLTFSTDGSYIEFGLGTKLKLTYDKNLLEVDYVAFELTQSMFYEANFVYSVTGELSKNWESALNLTDGFDLIIPHPYSTVANVSVLIKPDIVIGASGSVKGEFLAKANNKREGAVTFSFDSTSKNLVASKNISTSAENTAEGSMSVDIEAKANAYIFPNFALSPRVDFLRIQHPFGFGIVRSGVKVNNDFEGHFETGFTVTQQLEDTTSNLDANASFLITYQALVDYKFNVMFGTETLYEEETFTTLYESDKGIIFDWSISLLNTPTITTTQEGSKNYITFDIEATEHKDKIKFHYNTYGGEITTDNVLRQTLYDGKKIELKPDDVNIIKVKAVLLNSDIASGIWNFGSSYSLTATEIVTIKEEVTPNTNDEIVDASDLWATYPEPEVCAKELYGEYPSIFTYFEIEHDDGDGVNYTRCRYDKKGGNYAVLSLEIPTNGFSKSYNTLSNKLSSIQQLKDTLKDGIALGWNYATDSKYDYISCSIYKEDLFVESCETSIIP